MHRKSVFVSIVILFAVVLVWAQVDVSQDDPGDVDSHGITAPLLVEAISLSDPVPLLIQCVPYTSECKPVKRCAACGDGECQPIEGCVPSFCCKDICTDDCGPLNCPEDCEY